MTHTLEHWIVDTEYDEDDNFYRIYTLDDRDDDIPPDRTIALVNRNFGDDSIKNVMMMAAAPILLKALQHLQANPNDPRMHRQALDAINLVLR